MRANGPASVGTSAACVAGPVVARADCGGIVETAFDLRPRIRAMEDPAVAEPFSR